MNPVYPNSREEIFATYGLAGKIALVTGGASGIGLAIANTLAALGASVVITSRDPARAQEAAEKLAIGGLMICGAGMDVGDEQSVETAIEAIVREHGKLDILVNNAGISIRQAAIDLPLEDWKRALDTDLTGVFLSSRVAARQMMQSGGGQVINISSISGFAGGRIHPNPSYRAAKAGVINLTRALAVEWADHGIRVNGVAPGWVETEMTARLMSDTEAKARIVEMTPLARFCKPQDIAAAVGFLAGPGAAMITGHTIVVDGGYLAQ